MPECDQQRNSSCWLKPDIAMTNVSKRRQAKDLNGHQIKQNVNQGLLGGGITHLPAVLMLLSFGIILKLRRSPVANYLLLACVAYVAALLVRSWDLYLCSAFPIGLHWIWHLLTATAATTIICGAALNQPIRGVDLRIARRAREIAARV